jgi:hypothetical protein
MAQESIGELAATVKKPTEVDDQIYEFASKMILDGSDKPTSSQNVAVQTA